jgi:hypothetical protein
VAATQWRSGKETRELTELPTRASGGAAGVRLGVLASCRHSGRAKLKWVMGWECGIG